MLIQKYGPRDGEVLYEFGAGRLEDVEDAVSSALMALDDGRWSQQPVGRRKAVLQRFAILIEENREELALLESLDVGKPINDALTLDVAGAASAIRYNAEAADKLEARVYAVDRSSLSYQLRRPIGVVGAIVGWNFPLVLAAMKIGPALAMGNSLILKPSELTSLSAGRLAELALEAGIPPGVFNVVNGGPALGEAIARHQKVDLVTFTGSSRTGKRLLVAAGESNMKRLILECGGKAPNVVFDDCPDIEAVAEAVVARAFWNQGEVCSASSRLLVQESVKDSLLKALLRKTSALKPGDPLLRETTFGALVSRSHKEKVSGFIEAGKREGAKPLQPLPFVPPFERGFYLGPTIFDNVSSRQTIAQEEIFGPVLSLISFTDEAEAIRVANNTIYGLTAIVWTTNMGRAHRTSQGIRAGSVVINASAAPAGGAGAGVLSVGGHKQSGIGTEGGLDGLIGYTSSTAVEIFT
jgi:acyl-CoA reductase-like NAD-dependent aldehyde dehydrogenase